MELAGLAATLVTLPFSLDACLNLWSRLHEMLKQEKELEFFNLDLKIQRCRLEHLSKELTKAEIVSGRPGAFGSPGSASKVAPFVQGFVQLTQNLLSEAVDLVDRHSRTRSAGAILSRPRWTAVDKEALQNLLNHLTHLNSQMLEIVPPRIAERVRVAVACSLFMTSHPTSAGGRQGPFPEAPSAQGIVDFFAPYAGVSTLQPQQQAGPSHGQVMNPTPLAHLQLNFGDLSMVEPAAGVFDRPERGLVAIKVGSSVNALHPNETLGMIEWRPHFGTVETRRETMLRMESLVKTLILMADAQKASTARPDSGLGKFNFGSLRPIGWTSPNRSAYDKVGMVYELPAGQVEVPTCLSEYIFHGQKLKDGVPDLGSRFAMASQLTDIVSNLFLIGCRHKNLRSSNILLLGSGPVKELCLVGFADSRSAHEHQELQQKVSSLLPTDPNDDLYRPPVLRRKIKGHFPGQSSQVVTESSYHWQAHWDIYSLGVILLEIALWRTASQMRDQTQHRNAEHSRVNVTSADRFHSSILTKEVSKLPFRVGNIYTDMVRECLRYGQADNPPMTSHGESSKASLPGHMIFLAGVKAELARCVA